MLHVPKGKGKYAFQPGSIVEGYCLPCNHQRDGNRVMERGAPGSPHLLIHQSWFIDNRSWSHHRGESAVLLFFALAVTWSQPSGGESTV